MAAMLTALRRQRTRTQLLPSSTDHCACCAWAVLQPLSPAAVPRGF